MRLPVGGAAAALLASRVLQLGNSFAVSVAVVWAYGLSGAGVLALASLPAAVASLAVAFGLPSALPRSTLSEPQRAALGLAASVAALVPVAVLCAAYGHALGRDAGEATSLFALGLAGGLLGQVNVQQTLYVLQGRQKWAPLAPAVHAAGTLAAVAAPDLPSFALALLAARALGCLAGFLPLAYALPPRAPSGAALLDATRFAPLDLAGLLAEQLPVVLLSGALTRAELGVFGLIRQFVTVADTPGWSLVLNHYPDLVRDAAAAGPGLARRNERLAWLAAAGSLVASSAAALVVYRVPAVVPALPIVLAMMPARYLNNFCEQALRATGHVGDCAALALYKGLLSAALFGALAAGFGLWGAVAASALLSLLSGLMYRHRFLARFPGALRPIRPWRLA